MKFLVAFLFSVTAAHAGASTPMGFSDIRDACQDPAKFQNQVAPKNLQVTCEDRATKWKSVAASKVDLARTREIVSSFTSDKYSADPVSESIAVENQVATCPRFKEILEVVNFTKATSCEEILAFEGSATDFCTQILDKVRDSNPSAVDRSETGNEVDLCQSEVTQPKDPCDGRGQRGQRGQNDGRCQR